MWKTVFQKIGVVWFVQTKTITSSFLKFVFRNLTFSILEYSTLFIDILKTWIFGNPSHILVFILHVYKSCVLIETIVPLSRTYDGRNYSLLPNIKKMYLRCILNLTQIKILNVEFAISIRQFLFRLLGKPMKNALHKKWSFPLRIS